MQCESREGFPIRNDSIGRNNGRIEDPKDRKHDSQDREDRMPSLRIEPEKRLCPGFDPETIALHRVAEPGAMGFRVLDNFCEEHIQ